MEALVTRSSRSPGSVGTEPVLVGFPMERERHWCEAGGLEGTMECGHMMYKEGSKRVSSETW